MGHVWDDLLNEQDKAVLAKTDYGEKGASSWESRNIGQRPVVLVIDMQRFLVGRNVPILEAVEDHRLAMGEIAWHAMDYISPMLNACRKADFPIIYTRVIPRGCTADEEALEIVDKILPHQGELVLDKNYASAFYGTSLLTHLNLHGTDTVILVGNSTSGCLRATAVDARQMGFNVIVPVECTFDRIEASHKIALLDIWMKYGLVMPFEEVMAYLEDLAQEN